MKFLLTSGDYVIQKLFKVALIFVKLDSYRTRNNGRQFLRCINLNRALLLIFTPTETSIIREVQSNLGVKVILKHRMFYLSNSLTLFCVIKL